MSLRFSLSGFPRPYFVLFYSTFLSLSSPERKRSDTLDPELRHRKSNILSRLLKWISDRKSVVSGILIA